MTTLLDTVGRYALAHADAHGLARTPIPGLCAVCATAPSGLIHEVYRPLVCLLVQGCKEVTIGAHTYTFKAGDSLLIGADVPTVSRIVDASPAAPYLSLVLELDPTIVADLVSRMDVAPAGNEAMVRVARTESEVVDTALRLTRLLERPAALAILQDALLREMHYWLLAGRHGAAIRQLGWPDGHVQRIARAIAVLRAEYTRNVPVERLAAIADMSPSSFHHHFRAVTSLSPLQFQKHLRLVQARRLLITQGASASSAAFAVGYESVPQFTREYGRMFGASPARDARAAREQGGQRAA
ncbi:AraC family transcriptional regulator [Verticiella sediminum]|uniref:AraC family transcriptional regulator n=1 Tax=Verticiella sediminum TaxID=1247510 RepID=A0A556AUB3_9BURK|nr:AraC family transcriptional regulator [Verticiella sediminum]TSH96531.1 AraC family transcriptional regulator [Verticiella sediminum]